MTESGELRPAAKPPAKVVSVALSPCHGFRKVPQTSIQLLQGQGVQGDAHCGKTVQHLYLKRRNPLSPNLMQVHLLQSEFLETLAAAGYQLSSGDFGENILTSGVDLLSLPVRTRLLLGSHAVVELTGLRTPCRQIDDHYPGVRKLSTLPPVSGKRSARAGVMAVVVSGGVVAPADSIRFELPSHPHTALSLI